MKKLFAKYSVIPFPWQKQFDLIGGRLIAGDSTKLRAQNSKKNNFNENKIVQHLQYIEKRLDEYNQALVDADEQNKQIIQEQIEKQNDRKEKYLDLSKQLFDTEETQVSISDPADDHPQQHH